MMTEQAQTTSDSDRPVIYHIRLTGHLGHHWQAALSDVTITLEANGETLLTCVVTDQAALHGILRTVRDLGMPLIAVTRAGHAPEA